MTKQVLFTLCCLLSALAGPGFAQTSEGCEITVTNPGAGDVWVIDQRYSVQWTSGELCPQSFTKIELIGRQNGAVDKVLLSMSTVVNSGWLLFIPSRDLLGYPGYVFRFWGVAGQGGGQGSILGVSEVFLIAENDLPPLLADPLQMTFFLPAGTGTQTGTLYLIANADRTDWTAAPDENWITLDPAYGTVIKEAGALKVAVTVHAAGLATGRHQGVITLSIPSRADPTIRVAVDLVVSPSPGGTPGLATDPGRFVITHRLEETYTPRRFTLTNPGDGGTDWAVDTGADWLTISPSSGFLASGASVELVLLVSRAFSTPGSHRVFARFRGRSDAACDLPVNVNLVIGSAWGTWPPSGLARRTLPVAANAPGAHGSLWTTDVTALVTDGSSRAAQARWKRQALATLPAPSLLGRARVEALMAKLEEEAAASPRGTNQFIWGALGAKKARASEAVITKTSLPDDRPTLLTDALGQYFGLSGTSGFLQMVGEHANDVLLVSRTYSTEPDGDTYGQSVQAPAEREIIGPEGGTAYVPGLRYEPDASETAKGWRSNLFITEIGGVATPVTVRLFDAQGGAVGTALSKTLEPFSQWSLIPTAIAFNTTAPWTYAEVVSSGGGQIVVLGSVVDSDSNDPTTINGQVAGPAGRAAATLVLPAAVHTPGNFGTTWRSDVTVLNASDAGIGVKMRFIPMAGTGGEVREAWLDLGPREMGVYDDIVTKFNLESGVGTLVFEGADPGTFFAFNRIYNLADNGFTYGQGTSAYRPEDSVGLDDGTLFAVGLERSPKYRTNVGVVETAGASAIVLFTVVAPTGESRGYLARLAPGQWVQADDLIRDKAGFTGDYANVWVMINVVEGEGRVIGYSSIVDNQSSDATFIKLEKR